MNKVTVELEASELMDALNESDCIDHFGTNQMLEAIGIDYVIDYFESEIDSLYDSKIERLREVINNKTALVK